MPGSLPLKWERGGNQNQPPAAWECFAEVRRLSQASIDEVAIHLFHQENL